MNSKQGYMLDHTGKPSSTGERYIFVSRGGYVVLIATHNNKGRNQKRIGCFKELEDAVQARDKAVTEFL